MNKLKTGGSMEELMADPRLVELCELHRTGDSIFDVIDLTENQNSAMLAWMLDPKEGHGQGDEILRDLLSRASSVFASGESGLDKRGATARFFSAWPPSRIRTSTFASAFTATELKIGPGERIDLCVVDTQNKFVLVVENKAGARHADRQLLRYREEVGAALKANSKLRKFDQAFIAMDLYYDPEQEGERASGAYWLHLGYDWLETSAIRAQTHVERGNAAAKLVATYCQRMTDWESPSSERVMNLAAQLHQSYPEALETLMSSAQKRIEMEWLTGNGNDRSPMLFSLQNKSVIETLKETRGIASVMTSVQAAIKGLQRNSVEYGRSVLYPRGGENLGVDGYWPVYIQVKYATKDRTKFAVAICWRGAVAKTAEQAAKIRTTLAGMIPQFAKHIGSARRRVAVGTDLTLPELLRKLVALESGISAVLLDSQ